MSRLLTGPPLNAQVRAITRSNEVTQVLAEAPVDVVVCDVKSQPVSGPELATELATSHPEVKVILLSDDESKPLLLASLLSGAAGFFLKESAVDEFVAGVGTVLHGQCVVGNALLGQALTKLAGRGSEANREPLSQLSPAERNILVLVAQAHSIRSIAEARGLSPKTVRNHLARVYRKLQVRNRAEAMLWAARTGLTCP